MKLWGGRFASSTHALVDAFNASISFDQKLAVFDVQGSLAHVAMLAQCQLISAEDEASIRGGLEAILREIQAGQHVFRVEDEDIHMNIERLLHERIGPVAGKLHSGRSRNDQVALDVHLYLRHHVGIIVEKLYEFLVVLHQLASAHVDTLVPGYTHLQRAEPVRLAHHFLAYGQMFLRDVARLQDAYKRINICPLGAGALAGSGLPVDRQAVADALHFAGIYSNSLDAVSDRDFVVEFLAAAALMMMHLSRLSEELILWTSQEFGFIQLDDAFTTGSSMMPQKKNPDVCELTRGKTGRVYGALMGILTVLKGLPLAYNKDMQEDKEGLFDTVHTLEQTLSVYTPMLATMRVNADVMRSAVENDFSNATNLANYLTKRGVPFREAHEITGKMVAHCLQRQCLLADLTLAEFKSWQTIFDEDIYQALSAEQVVEDHQAAGGTARQSVLEQLEAMDSSLQGIQAWLAPLNK